MFNFTESEITSKNQVGQKAIKIKGVYKSVEFTKRRLLFKRSQIWKELGFMTAKAIKKSGKPVKIRVDVL